MFKLAVFIVLVAVAFGKLDKKAFKERAHMIEDINSKTDLWEAGVSPKFSSMRMVDLLGVFEDNQANIDAAIAAGDVELVHYDPSTPIPDEFDSAANWPECAQIIGDIRDQSNCGCCWAFGTSSAASDRYCIATNGQELVTFSAQDVCFCASFNGCGGGFTQTAWKHIQKGVVSGGQYNNTGGPIKDLCSAYSLPHCHHHGPQGDDPFPAEGAPGCPSERSPKCPRRCDENAKAPHDVFANDSYSFSGSISSYSSVEAIQQAIMTAGPVATAFTVYADFESYVSGVYHHVSGSSLGGHAVRFVGWGVDNGVKYWKVANSWNPYWGEEGYFRIIRGTNEGNIESQVVASADDVTWSAPRG